jgi:SpoVK/Ycf46/Vps4 family AAA+-type ATPase
MLTAVCTGPAGLQAAAAADGLDAAMQPGLVTTADFVAAMQRVGPSIVRGAAVEVSPVSWDDVGGYARVKQRLRQAVEWPLQHAGGW